jgi:hypothetical protein
MLHGLEATLLVLFDLGQAKRPESGENVDFAP